MQQDIIKVNDKTINSIQALRGIAALMVVLVHFKIYFNLPFYNFGNSLFSYGGMGVPLFFVTSGFVMTYTHTRTGAKEALSFIIKRFSRVFPLYFIATIIYLLVLKYSVPTAPEFNNPTDIIKSLLFYPLKATGAPNLGLSSLFVGWTLNFEMFFYAIFAISIMFGKWMWLSFAAIFATLLYIIPSFNNGFSMVTEHEQGFSVAYMSLITNPIIINFIAGVIVAFIVKKIDLDKVRKFKSVHLWLTCLLCVVCAWQYFSGFRAGWGYLQWGFISSLVVLALVSYEKAHGFSCKPLVYLGSISFSVYLLHPLVKECIQIMFIKIGHPEFAGGPMMGFSILAGIILVSHWSRDLIEVKLSNYVRDRLIKVNGLNKSNVTASQ